MKSRKFPMVHARPPAIPRLCLHEPCPMDSNADGISHVKSGVSQSSCGLYEHRMDIGLEDLRGPARIWIYLQSRISQTPSTATHRALEPAHPASTLRRFNLRTKIAKRTQFCPDIPRDGTACPRPRWVALATRLSRSATRPPSAVRRRTDRPERNETANFQTDGFQRMWPPASSLIKVSQGQSR